MSLAVKRQSKDRRRVESCCYLKEMRGDSVRGDRRAGPAHSRRAGHDLATEELSSAHQLLLFYKYNQLLFDLSTSGGHFVFIAQSFNSAGHSPATS